MWLCAYEAQQFPSARHILLLTNVQIAYSLAFTNFVLERCQPYRVCDFFDEVSTGRRVQSMYIQYVQGTPVCLL